MKKSFFVRYSIFLITLILFVTCPSCGRKSSIFDFTNKDATFCLIIPSELCEITLDCVRDGDLISASVVSPERSRGISIHSDSTSVTLSVDGTKIPLSSDAAREYSLIFDLMFRGDIDARATKSEDGECTIITYDDGVLTLDKNGLPIEIELGRKIKIANYLTEE